MSNKLLIAFRTNFQRLPYSESVRACLLWSTRMGGSLWWNAGRLPACQRMSYGLSAAGFRDNPKGEYRSRPTIERHVMLRLLAGVGLTVAFCQDNNSTNGMQNMPHL